MASGPSGQQQLVKRVDIDVLVTDYKLKNTRTSSGRGGEGRGGVEEVGTRGVGEGGKGEDVRIPFLRPSLVSNLNTLARSKVIYDLRSLSQ
jgi:hypothetical protein